ncbi:MAG: hypothetical protein L6R38_003038 [Xanthoria sp. 2 TBL-2021]|nr:MAG: hypothetical protein L6R38_003038 [Xanthoria sp. 2 TBL-2021]
MGGNTLSRMVLGQQMLDQMDDRRTDYVSRRTGMPVPRPDRLGGPRSWDPPRRNQQMQPAMGFGGPPHMMGGGMPPGMGSRASRMSGAAMGGAGMGPPPPGFGNMATNGTIGGPGPAMHGAGGMGPPGGGGHRMPTASTRASGMSTHASRAASRASRASGHEGGGPGEGPRGPPGGGAGGRRQRRDRYATDG